MCNSDESDDSTFIVADVEMDNPLEDVVKKNEPEIEADRIIPLETLVAALTVTAEGSEEWILAKIKGFDGKLYTVEDAEVEEEPSIEIAQKEYFNTVFIIFIILFI